MPVVVPLLRFFRGRELEVSVGSTMLRVFAVLIAIPVLAADPGPPGGRKVQFTSKPLPPAELAKVLKQQTGTDVEVSSLDSTKLLPANFDKVDFWTALESIASSADARIVTTGGKIALKPGRSKSPSYVAGPFRFTANDVQIRGDVETGASSYSLSLDVAWEPWLNAYRIDAVPKITKAVDDTGKVLAVGQGGARTFTSGIASSLTIHPQGVTRAAKSVSLTGTIRLTIADELLTFSMPLSDKLSPAQKGVSIGLVKHGPDGDDWIAEIELHYPKSEVVWESYEYYWVQLNPLKLVPPKGEPIELKHEQTDRFIRYKAKGQAKAIGNAAGWKLDYRTPGPMREIVVPFELKAIALP